MNKQHHKRSLWIITCMAGILLLLPVVAAYAQYNQVTLKATLILANNDGAPLDYRLDKVERKLRKIFGFKYYKFYGEADTSTTLPANITLTPGHGCKLVIETSDGGDHKVRAMVHWIQDDAEVLSTSVRVKRQAPTILGGPSHDGGTLIVVLTAE